MELPGRSGIARKRRRIPVIPLVYANKLALGIARQIDIGRRFVVRRRENQMALPRARRHSGQRLGAGIAVPEGFLPWKTNLNDVHPSVRIQIVRENEKIIRVAGCPIKRTTFVVRNPICEIGAAVPERSGYQVVVAVAIQIGEAGALGPKCGVEGLPGERVQKVTPGRRVDHRLRSAARPDSARTGLAPDCGRGGHIPAPENPAQANDKDHPDAKIIHSNPQILHHGPGDPERRPCDADAMLNNAAEIRRRALETIAGGVVSLNRKVEPAIVFTRALGSRLWDTEGKEYIDYHAAFAPYFLGHNNPEINGAVIRSMLEGWSLMGSGTTTWEVELAESLKASVPSMQKVQITNTGSEATAHAIRLSRAFTGRDHVILTLGGYNGWHNDVARSVAPSLEVMGPRRENSDYPFFAMSAGIPEGVKQRIHLVNFNDADSIAAVMAKYPIACVLTEPVLQNIGVVHPKPGYLQAVRKLCDENGSLLVFDEVKTGFRTALGGYQSICKVRPDLSVFGKAVANGYPMGVIGGRADVMDLFDSPDPTKRVLIAGTYNAHPFTVAAAIATLEILRRDDGAIYKQIEMMAVRLQAGIEGIVKEKGLTATYSRNASASCLYFADHVPVDLHDLQQSHNFALDTRYRRALIDRGVYLFPLPTKQASISGAHTMADIDRTLEITREAITSL